MEKGGTEQEIINYSLPEWAWFTTLDRILILKDLLEENRDLNTILHTQLFQQLGSFEIPIDMQLGICVRKVQSPNGLSEVVASTYRVKQECPQSRTFFGLYIDEVSHYKERLGGLRACLAGIAIQILL